MSHPSKTAPSPNPARVQRAKVAALIFTIGFAGWTFVAALLVATIPVARTARIGFALVTAAAAVAMWSVFMMIRAAQLGDAPTWTQRTRARILERLRTPRH